METALDLAKLAHARAQAYNDAAARENAVYGPVLADAEQLLRRLDDNVKDLAAELAIARIKVDTFETLAEMLTGRGRLRHLGGAAVQGRDGSLAPRAVDASPEWLLNLSRGTPGGKPLADRIADVRMLAEKYQAECAASLRTKELEAAVAGDGFEPVDAEDGPVEGQDPLPGIGAERA